jgi:hypothetical protein
MVAMQDYYSILNVFREATNAEIRKTEMSFLNRRRKERAENLSEHCAASPDGSSEPAPGVVKGRTV